jgi:hypothetical protein
LFDAGQNSQEARATGVADRVEVLQMGQLSFFAVTSMMMVMMLHSLMN